jgi:ribosome-associated heat shock protein Hsp15
MSVHSAGQRIDTWLWYARFYKTRSLATAIVSKGRVRVTSGSETRKITKASSLVRPGDQLTFKFNDTVVQVTVLALGERRGPASDAQKLYQRAENEVIDKKSWKRH